MPARILITTDSVGGIWQYTRDLVQALSQAGYSILVCALGPAAASEQLVELRNLGTNIHVEQNTGPLEWMPGAWAQADGTGEWLLQQAKIFQPDIVHLNSYSYAALRWDVPVVVVAHSCVGTWWRAVHGTPPGPEWGEYTRRVKSGLQSADSIVAPSAALAADLARCYGLNSSSIKVIHNATSVTDGQRSAFEELRSTTDSRSAPTSAEVPLSSSGAESRPVLAVDKQPFCLAAGRLWDGAKNLSLLHRIAERVTWPVYVAGEKSEAATTTANVHYLGKLNHPDFLGYLKRASLFLHPALYEPFGLVVLEAARFGCALLLSDIASMRELWSGAAEFLAPKDSDAWVDAVNRLTSDKVARAELSARAARHSLRYTQAAQAIEYQKLYGGLLRESRQKRAVAI